MARRKKVRKLSKKEVKAIKKTEAAAPAEVAEPVIQKPRLSGTIELPDVVTVGDFANRLGLPVTEVVKALMANGVMATINESIDRDTAALVADEFGATVTKPGGASSMIEKTTPERVLTKGSIPRPPVVVVLGHVDHGKTTLLDTIRRTTVATKESGGITQHIGAYQSQWHGQDGADRTITFLDTPGHAAFSAMRAHGAALTDVAILVVAADDGVKPQTIEAISHARAANVPIVVAINKIDVPGANADRVKRELAQHELVAEEYGGSTPMVSIAAKDGTNVSELLDVVLLVADVAELSADPAAELVATVIEARQETGAGVVATVLVQNGTLAVGDTLVVGSSLGRVKFVKTATGERVLSAGPATPVQIAGLDRVPAVGQRLERVADERTARALTEARGEAGQAVRTLGDISQSIRRGTNTVLPVILKADVRGSVDAIQTSLEQLSTTEAEVRLLHTGVGPVNESDVQLAIASQALIVAFRVPLSPAAKSLAEHERVVVLTFDVIYALLDDVQAALEGQLEPEEQTTVVGTLKVLKTFRTTPTEKLVGGIVTTGEIRRGGVLQIRRSNELIGTGKLVGLQQGPEKVDQVPNGSECGILVGTKVPIQVGDRLDCLVTEVKTVRLGTAGQ